MKTKFQVFKLHFKTPLHLGDERDDYSISLKTYRSDAMYAAITSVLASIGYSIPDDGDLGFQISSLFPYYQKVKDSKVVYFLPKLLIQPKVDEGHLDYMKKIKKVSWLDIPFFEKQIAGKNLFGKSFEKDSIIGDYLTSEEIDKDFISSEISPRVTVPRDPSQDAKPFYMDRIYFKGHSGLYFLVQGNTNLLKKALEILKDEGIGTDRNVGNGYFEWSEETIEISLPPSEYVSNLSLFCPESEQQLKTMLGDAYNTTVAYDFIKRGGWITKRGLNTFRKNSLHMFTEASVFRHTESVDKVQVLGKIHDVKPEIEHQKIEHPIWRNGKALFIPVIPTKN